MKLLVCLVGIGIITFFVYSLLSFHRLHKKNKKIKTHTFSWKILGVAVVVGLLLCGGVCCFMYRSAKTPDTYCSTPHTAKSQPPTELLTAADYYHQADYDYETGNCTMAIQHYSKSIDLDPKLAQAYNNRAYTYMRLHQYDKALPDLDKAIALKPNYIQARMNRGDIRHYYYAVDRGCAINDYVAVVAYGGGRETSVCGHLFLARHGGWNFKTFLFMPLELLFKYNCK